MKNQYMFFNEQLFEGFDLSGFEKKDICIPNTNVHIYEFVCVEGEECSNDEAKAKLLDSLSRRLLQTYPDSFQIVGSESSQFFCGQLYPLVVGFETKLRYALYISRALFEKENLDTKSFLFDIRKEKKPIEAIAFGEIYDAVFKDKSFKTRFLSLYQSDLTKADLIKLVQSMDENIIWRNIVGAEYDYTENHFVNIKDYRNDVMHNHLICYERFIMAREILQKAIAELDRVIRDKLIVNRSEYLNKVNVVDALGGMIRMMRMLAVKMDQFVNSTSTKNVLEGLTRFGELMVQFMAPLADDIALPDTSDESKITDEQEDEDNA